MVNDSADPAFEITRLKAKVAALEHLLRERSMLLRHLARVVCEDDLVNFSRLAFGDLPMPSAGIGLRGWHETMTVSSTDVEETMKDLWRSTASPTLD
ncbi:MAG TPA: hypothetical protein VJA66_04430 [Thermoanaerobaculia bacterium]